MVDSRAKVKKGCFLSKEIERSNVEETSVQEHSKIKRSDKLSTKGSGPCSKFAKTSGSPRIFVKGDGPSRKSFILKGK